MEEQLVTSETAKLAKEKGFEVPTYPAYIGNKFYENEDKPNGYDGHDLATKENWNRKDWVFTKDGGGCFGCKDDPKYFEAYSVPTQSLLQKWLREQYKIHVENNHEGDDTFICRVSEGNNIGRSFVSELSEQYEFAKVLEEGLQEALKLINTK